MTSLDPNKERQMVVVGSKQRIAVDDVNIQKPLSITQKGIARESFSGFGDMKLFVRDGDMILPRIPNEEPLKNQILHFAQSINTNTQPIPNGELGLMVARISEAVEKSIHQKGAPVTIQQL
jgi:predicted dehydrogenase